MSMPAGIMPQLESLHWRFAPGTSPLLGQAFAAASSQLTRLELLGMFQPSLETLACLTALRSCAVGIHRDNRGFSLHAPGLAWMARLSELRLDCAAMRWSAVAAVAAAGHWSGLRSLCLVGHSMFHANEQYSSLVRLDHLSRLHVWADTGGIDWPDWPVIYCRLISGLEQWRLPALAALSVPEYGGGSMQDDDSAPAWQQHLGEVVRKHVAPAVVSIRCAQRQADRI